jgi:hypothetical protein
LEQSENPRNCILIKLTFLKPYLIILRQYLDYVLVYKFLKNVK